MTALWIVYGMMVLPLVLWGLSRILFDRCPAGGLHDWQDPDLAMHVYAREDECSKCGERIR
jgi:hypothetical protein